MTTLIHNRPTIRRLLVLLVLITFSTGCSSMQPLPMMEQAAIGRHLEPGDNVRIITDNGEEIALRVTGVSESGVSGEGTFVAFADISEVYSEQFDLAETVGLTVAIVLALYLALGAAAAASGLPPAGF